MYHHSTDPRPCSPYFASSEPSSPIYPPSPSTPCPASPMIPVIPDEDDEYTLSAFGDISLSEDCFIPSLPSNASPVKGDSRPRTRASQPNSHRGATAKRPRPPLMSSKTKNPYNLIAKAAIAQPQLNLKDIVDSMKAKGKFAPPPIKVAPRTPVSSRPSLNRLSVSSTPPLTPSSAPNTPRSPTTPKSPASPKPFRGYGPMPKRLPLPKWDQAGPAEANRALTGRRYGQNY